MTPEARARKERPLYEGLFRYFPDALEEVAHLSLVANEQHNPGQPLHWAKEKSKDEWDAMLRHTADEAKGNPIDTDGIYHDVKVAWRALAKVQRRIEGEKEPSMPEVLKKVDAQIGNAVRRLGSEEKSPRNEDMARCPTCGRISFVVDLERECPFCHSEKPQGVEEIEKQAMLRQRHYDQKLIEQAEARGYKEGFDKACYLYQP